LFLFNEPEAKNKMRNRPQKYVQPMFFLFLLCFFRIFMFFLFFMPYHSFAMAVN